MFCPKCRNHKLPKVVQSTIWISRRRNVVTHCTECGALLCSDHIATEFDAAGYAPRAEVHNHRLNGLVSVGMILSETRSDATVDLASVNRPAQFTSLGRSFHSSPNAEPQYAGQEREHLGVVGRYDSPTSGLSEIGYPTNSVYDQARRRPSPFPVIVFIITLEIVVSFFVYANRTKPAHHQPALRPAAAIIAQSAAQPVVPEQLALGARQAVAGLSLNRQELPHRMNR